MSEREMESRSLAKPLRALALAAFCGILTLWQPVRAGAGETQPPGGEDQPPEAEPPLETLIPGTWRGLHTAGGRGYQHRIEVRRRGAGYVGVGLTWFGITEAQATEAAAGRPPRKVAGRTPTCVYQTFAVSLLDDVLTFRGTEAKKLLRGRSTYVPDIFSGQLKRPGVFTGEAADAKRRDGYFELCREEVWTAVPALTLEKGKIHKQLDCLDGGKYHYSCYIPRSYDPRQPVPVLINHSPGGRAGPLNYKMAEEVGWIMVGLTESRNGPPKPCVENRDAVLFDLRRRFNIDWTRVYFSGFSGGARASSFAGCTYPGICGGLILTGAAHTGSGYPSVEVPIFFIAGTTDMNKKEVEAAHERSKREGRKTSLIIHPRGHTGPSSEESAAAIRWLEELARAAPKSEEPAVVEDPPASSQPPPPPTGGPGKKDEPARRTEIAPEWDAKLVALLKRETSAGRRPRVHLSALGDTFSVTGVSGKDELRLSSGPVSMACPWSRLTAGDKTGIAISLARTRDEDCCCVAAYFLLKDGKPDKAEELLRMVKDERKAEEVRAAAR